MRELETAVAAWRAVAADLFRDREDVLDELESHLWDAAEQLCAAGSAPVEAVRIAAERLGSPCALAAEFAKVPARPLPWWPARLAWVTAALVATGVVAPLLPRFANGGVDASLAAHVTGVTLGYSATLLVGALSEWLLLARLFRVPKAGFVTTWRRTVIGLSALAAGLTAAGIAFAVPCPVEKTGWCAGLDARELGGVAIALWNVAILGYLWRARPGERAILVGAAGSTVVVLGWLAAARIENHRYGFANSPLAIALFLTLTLAVGLTALAPAGRLRARN